ncbi:MAG: PaaI family thioesterase [Actinomycetota bacterium]
MTDDIIDEPVRGAIGDQRAYQLSGLESVRRYMRGELPAPPVWRLTGTSATDVGLGKATFSMPITRWYEDAFGLVWAGVFALFADGPLGAALWTGLPAGKMVTTSELNLSFVRPFTRETGNLVGRASSIHLSRQVGLSSVEISDRNGRLMGYGTTRCLINDVPVDPDAEYPEPETGPDDPPDPYLREAPTDGYFDPETIVSSAGLDIQRRLLEGELVPNIWRFSGYRWDEVEEGRATVRFPTTPWFSTGAPTLYGGAIAWMAESAMGSAVLSTLGAGEVFGTLDMNVRFIRPVKLNSGDVTIAAEVQHRGRRMRIASAEVVGADGNRIAIATSSVLLIPGGIRALMQGRLPDEILNA